MNKRVFGIPDPVEVGQAAMLRDKRIPKLHELTASILRRIGRDHSVMQMNLNLSPT
jgi:hypothetical protein